MAGLGDGCPLSPREHEVLLLIMRGRSYKQAALALGVSASTVRTVLGRIYRKLEVAGAGQAAVVMLREGWARPREVLPEDEFTTWLRSIRRDNEWKPSAAQRCYLTAFGRLLLRRDVAAAYAAHLAFQLMCVEAGLRIPRASFDPARAIAQVDDMLLRLATCLLRPLYADLDVAA